MRKDPWLWGALVAGMVLRIVPMFFWPADHVVRDEIVYRYLATGIWRDGVMGVTTKGWVAAPGYPYALVVCRAVFGSIFAIKGFQIALSITTIPVIAAIASRVGAEKGRRAARIAAWGFALHPTLAWYTNTLWIETLYIGLLLPAVLAVLLAREAGRSALIWGGVAGVLLGICVLFRGIALPLPFVFALALVWPAEPTRRGVKEAVSAYGRGAGVLLLAAILAVAPYSVFASRQYGGLVISDATVGHVLYLGNNDFEPMTFDYGNGVLTQPLYHRTVRSGRRPCPRFTGELTPAQVSRCEVGRAAQWIADHPGRFLARVPLRLAQQMNPNSFLTRHVRWGGFALPWWARDLVCAWIVLTSVLVVGGGTLAGIAKGRGPFAVMAGGTMALTMLAAAVMYGMTRFRLPLEPLWMIWLAVGLSNPRGTLRALRGGRAVAALVVMPCLAGLTWWFALTGFPMFWR